MKRYCFDTSGISNPLETMPDDIHTSMWEQFNDFVASGKIAVTQEIYDEMIHIPGMVGDHLKAHKKELVLEVAAGDWDWQSYVKVSADLNVTHNKFISEYSGGSPKTIGLNDMTIVSLAKALDLPLVSMEVSVMASPIKKRIPDICKLEDVGHMRFNDFLRAEKFKY